MLKKFFLTKCPHLKPIYASLLRDKNQHWLAWQTNLPHFFSNPHWNASPFHERVLTHVVLSPKLLSRPDLRGWGDDWCDVAFICIAIEAANVLCLRHMRSRIWVSGWGSLKCSSSSEVTVGSSHGSRSLPVRGGGSQDSLALYCQLGKVTMLACESTQTLNTECVPFFHYLFSHSLPYCFIGCEAGLLLLYCDLFATVYFSRPHLNITS